MDDQELENAVDQESAQDETQTRAVLAIGDLHGDYHRLLRHLRSADLLLPDTMAWNPEKDKTDVVLIGDYADWRGEPLEPPIDQSPTDSASGGRRILECVFNLDHELELLRRELPGFDSHIYPLLGNHDSMMLESVKVFDFISIDALSEQLSKATNYYTLRRGLADLNLTNEQVEKVAHFINWYTQGGSVTISGFGGMEMWKNRMEGELGTYMRECLYLAVIINNRLYAHTLPDSSKFWRPLQDLAVLEPEEYLQVRESFMWSRKIWGIDYYSGVRTSPFTEKELDTMFNRIGCTSAVIGHTPLSRGTDHVVVYEGKVRNIDVHGSPGSKAFFETYQSKGNTTVAPLRSELYNPAVSGWA